MIKHYAASKIEKSHDRKCNVKDVLRQHDVSVLSKSQLNHCKFRMLESEVFIHLPYPKEDFTNKECSSFQVESR